MYPARIEHYERPQSVAEALAALGRFEPGDAIFLAGGMSAMQAMKSRMLQPRCVIDLQDVAELQGVTREHGALRLGAMTRYAAIAADAAIPSAYQALRDAAAHVGDRQVRNRGTIGGSVSWNYVASCMPATVLGLRGAMLLAAADGSTRRVVADDFFLGPLETARRDDEILLAVEFPAPPAHCGSAYAKWGLIKDALPVVGICVMVGLDDDDKCVSARIALSGLADGCQRASAGEASLLDSEGDEQAIAVAMDAIAESVETQSDQSADADYRRQLIRSVGREVAARAFARARGQ
ncbi:MAG: FAD binding domain-containing protein [Gammaproteobacteria bacterium]|nr:FAD binding domain-containing protein [Gammaproteobacteria bacterium]MCP5201960.1 FAD binding domain-containing protein [Gammaproteobacteria bacterium]